MRLVSYQLNGTQGLALRDGNQLRSLRDDQGNSPTLEALLRAGLPPDLIEKMAERGESIDPADIRYLPPVGLPSKIICVGLNYTDHAHESGFPIPEFPEFFGRFASSLIGHGAPIILPQVSDQLDYEAELAVVIGKRATHVSRANALQYVAGYSVFNDATIRDVQLRGSQWTLGKNFDATGAFGPDFVTADELPPGANGLLVQLRLNGKVLQNGNTGDMIFDVARLIEIITVAVTLEPGDVIITGTPAGVGFARNPRVLMRPGDVCEVEIEGIGRLSNPITASV